MERKRTAWIFALSLLTSTSSHVGAYDKDSGPYQYEGKGHLIALSVFDFQWELMWWLLKKGLSNRAL